MGYMALPKHIDVIYSLRRVMTTITWDKIMVSHKVIKQLQAITQQIL